MEKEKVIRAADVYGTQAWKLRIVGYDNAPAGDLEELKRGSK